MSLRERKEKEGEREKDRKKRGGGERKKIDWRCRDMEEKREYVEPAIGVLFLSYFHVIPRSLAYPCPLGGHQGPRCVHVSLSVLFACLLM